jgi:hypothetical protein
MISFFRIVACGRAFVADGNPLCECCRATVSP